MFALNQKVGQQTLVNLKLMNKQTNWYRFRIFRNDSHWGDLPRAETRITKDIRMAYRLYAKVKIAFPKYRTIAINIAESCSLRVRRRHQRRVDRCPLYPQKRTSPSTSGMSALCQKRAFNRLASKPAHAQSGCRRQRRQILQLGNRGSIVLLVGNDGHELTIRTH